MKGGVDRNENRSEKLNTQGLLSQTTGKEQQITYKKAMEEEMWAQRQASDLIEGIGDSISLSSQTF